MVVEVTKCGKNIVASGIGSLVFIGHLTISKSTGINSGLFQAMFSQKLSNSLDGIELKNTVKQPNPFFKSKAVEFY